MSMVRRTKLVLFSDGTGFTRDSTYPRVGEVALIIAHALRRGGVQVGPAKMKDPLKRYHTCELKKKSFDTEFRNG